MTDTPRNVDPITLEVLRNQFESAAEEMGRTLIRGAYSPNIKERRDCSTALFDADGRMVAQAEHIPVHLGAMPEAVAAVREHDPGPGDVYILNDPFRGGGARTCRTSLWCRRLPHAARSSATRFRGPTTPTWVG